MNEPAQTAAPGAAEREERTPLRWSNDLAVRILLEWHGEVTGEGNGGARSALRRVGPAEDACLVPEYGALVVRLNRARFDVPPPRAMRLAAEAVAVAEIDRSVPLARRGDGEADPDASDDATEGEGAADGHQGPREGGGRREGSFVERVALSFAHALRGPDRSRPLVSPARARLLLQTDEFEPFLRLLRGMLGMIRAKGQPVSAVAVAEIVRSWRDPDRRALMRRHIALALADDLDRKD